MTTLNMEEIDKTNFKAFRLPDDSIYFGEVVWIDQSGHFTGAPSPEKHLTIEIYIYR